MVKQIIKNFLVLKQPCSEVVLGENILDIIQDLKDTFKGLQGYGLAANQIGYFKRVILVILQGEEQILVNPKIEFKENKFIFLKETCFSFPGLAINTSRWFKIGLRYNIFGEDGVLQEFFKVFEGLEAVVLQHELDHLNGLILVDRVHRKKK
jgi:peptide deformylase